MSSIRSTILSVLSLHMQGADERSIATKLGLDSSVVKQALASVEGFTQSQINDLCIVLGFNTVDEVNEWRAEVGDEEAIYGAALLDMAGVNLVDYETKNGPYPDAMNVIRKVMK